jgi:hypothetical protein
MLAAAFPPPKIALNELLIAAFTLPTAPPKNHL